MIKKTILLFACILITGVAHAERCNRTHPDDGDYLERYEFCDDDFANKKLPKFEDFAVPKIDGLTPKFPKEIPDSGGDKNWVNAWNEAILETYKEKGVNFAGHYLLAQRDCGSGCRLILFVDLLTGIAYRPLDTAKIITSVNPLSASALKKLNIEEDDVCSYKKNSKLLVIIGSLGEETKRHGVYYFKWENNQLKLISKIEKKSGY